MLLVTSHMTSGALQTRWWRKNIVTGSITSFTLRWHSISNDNKTVTFVLNRFSTVTILILREFPLKIDQTVRFSTDLSVNDRIGHGGVRIIQHRLSFAIVENLKDFRNHTRIDPNDIT